LGEEKLFYFRQESSHTITMFATYKCGMMAVEPMQLWQRIVKLKIFLTSYCFSRKMKIVIRLLKELIDHRAENGPGLTIPIADDGPGRAPEIQARPGSFPVGRVTYNRSRDARDLKSFSVTRAQRQCCFFTPITKFKYSKRC
jgi:hypothetical protein